MWGVFNKSHLVCRFELVSLLPVGCAVNSCLDLVSLLPVSCAVHSCVYASNQSLHHVRPCGQCQTSVQTAPMSSLMCATCSNRLAVSSGVSVETITNVHTQCVRSSIPEKDNRRQLHGTLNPPPPPTHHTACVIAQAW